MIIKTSFDLPEIDRAEVLRYAGEKGDGAEIESLLSECLSLSADVFSPKVVGVCFDTAVLGDTVRLEDCEIKSKSLAGLLEGADKTIVFCATVGFGIDRLIEKYTKISPPKALILQAIGAERAEALCDAFCAGFENRTARKSPGYGDIPLEMQKYITEKLDTQRKIGVALNESLLLSPSKSVTALFGIKA